MQCGAHRSQMLRDPPHRQQVLPDSSDLFLTLRTFLPAVPVVIRPVLHKAQLSLIVSAIPDLEDLRGYVEQDDEERGQRAEHMEVQLGFGFAFWPVQRVVVLEVTDAI